MPKIKPVVKKCRWCKTKFEAGGRGRPMYSVVFCSKACMAMARVRKPVTRKMSVPEAAYLAGLIDGEGSIIAARKLGTGRTTWRLQVASTTDCLLDWCIEKTGVGTIVVRLSQNPKHADSKWWQCYSWNAMDVLKQCEPYMILKRDKARNVIQELSAIARIAKG